MPSLETEFSPNYTEIPSPSQFLTELPCNYSEGTSVSGLGGSKDLDHFGGPMHGADQGAMFKPQSAHFCNVMGAQKAVDQGGHDQGDIQCLAAPSSNSFSSSSPRECIPPKSNDNAQIHNFKPQEAIVESKLSAVEENAKDGAGGKEGWQQATPQLKTIEVHIPSPVKVDFIPNKADMIISTPLDVSSDKICLCIHM